MGTRTNARTTLFWTYLVLVLLGAAGVVWLPANAAVLDPLYLGLLGSSVLATSYALLRDDGGEVVRRGWTALAVGLLLYSAGDVLWVHYARTGRDPYPSPADGLFIAGTLVMIGGAYLLSRHVTGRLAVWKQLDVALVALAVGSVVWTQSVVPYVDGVDLRTAEGLITAAYPALDVLLTAAVARLLISSRRSTPALRLLLASLALLTVVDVVYYRMELAGTYAEWGLLDGGFALAVTGVGVAALHPSAFDTQATTEKHVRLSGPRLALLVAAAVTPLLLLVVLTALDLPGQGPVLPLVGAVAVGLLAMRSWLLVRISREVDELRHARQLSGMVRDTSDALLVLDGDARVVYGSPALLTRYRLDPEALVGRHVQDLVGVDEREAFAAWLAVVTTTPDAPPLQTELLDEDQAARTVHVTASLLDEAIDGGRLLLTARDISDRVALEDALRIRAERDALTGLANRATFTTMLERTIERGSAAVVLFIDVDDFKDVNDVLGHDVGDELLCLLASRIQGAVRPSDGVARLGGDEFAVLLTGTLDSEDVASAYDRIADRLCTRLDVAGRTVRTSVSIGVAAIDDGDDPFEVLRRADLAMYSAKRDGKAQVAMFDEALAERAERDHQLRTRLGRAVAAGEMWLEHQRVVAVDDGVRTAGHEVLLRWELDGRPVGPDEFIPIAESTGDIVPIGAWVVRQACAETAAVLGTADDGPAVSVNVSAVQLQHGGFEEVVAGALRSSGLPPHRLVLELTESVMAEEAGARDFLSLRSLGVRLAIDDFGTGWCSLAYLRRFPVDVVKVDRTFADDLTERPGLVDGIVRLVESTGATCLMEGIETEEQLEVARSLGIRRAQGWLFGRPTRLADRSPVTEQPADDRAALLAPGGPGDGR